MKKKLALLGLALALAGCGGGGSGGGDDNIPTPTVPSGLRLTSFTVSPTNTNVNVGDTVTVSARWTSDVPLTQTRVKVCWGREPYYFCDSNSPRLYFTCDGSGDACQGGFTITCTYEQHPVYSGERRFNCTLPDGSQHPTGGAGSLPKRFCVLLYLEATDVNGNTLYAQHDTEDRCMTLQP